MALTSNTPMPIRDLWQTPNFIFNWLNSCFDFDCDVAASAENTLCSNFIDVTQNALKTDWHKSNFCNPPYSNILPWVEKCIDEAKKGNLSVLLIPCDCSVTWFKKAFDNASELIMISGRIAFINAETQMPVSGNNKGSVVFVFRPKRVVKTECMTYMIDRNEIFKKYHNKHISTIK